jgi:lipid II:glycine glycyltransferase (peptidoglycan interpeptide bridge formation enzyme)
MDLVWNPADAGEWDDFHRRHHGALQQSWAYGEALKALGVHVHRALLRLDGRLIGIAQLSARRWLGYLYLASCSRGPVWTDAVSGETRRHFYRLIKRTLPARPWRAVVFSPDSTETETVAPEWSGMSRVMTGYATAALDLRQPLPVLRAQMASKWRNRLQKSESDPSLHVFVQASMRQCETLLGHEESQRRERGFHGLPVGFVRAYIQAHAQPEQAYVVAWTHQKQETTAAMLVLLHGASATYHMGWANEAGRKSNAHNLLLWRLMEHLQAHGVEKFDLGGINTSDLPGISRFKLGTGGVPRVLAGTYF